MAKRRVKKRVYDCRANNPCPHSTKERKSRGSKRFKYGPPCANCKVQCEICDDEIKRGEAWAHIPAIGYMHRRKCTPGPPLGFPRKWRSTG